MNLLFNARRCAEKNFRALALIFCFLLASCGGGADDQLPEQVGSTAPTIVKNAGLVIVHPFTPRLFQLLAFTDGNQFNNRAAQERAALHLHFLATGWSGELDDSMNIENILAGLDPNTTATFQDDFPAAEIDLSESLLNSIIANWGISQNISTDALRDSFLMRSGLLYDRGTHWELHIERRAFDILLTKLNWQIAQIHYPWMKKPIIIEW